VSRPKKDPLRPFTNSERRFGAVGTESQRSGVVGGGARALLAVSDGSSYTEAAQPIGRALGDSVAAWVSLFNQLGLAAVERQPGGRPPTRYGAEERDRILAEFQRRCTSRAADSRWINSRGALFCDPSCVLNSILMNVEGRPRAPPGDYWSTSLVRTIRLSRTKPITTNMIHAAGNAGRDEAERVVGALRGLAQNPHWAVPLGLRPPQRGHCMETEERSSSDKRRPML
jgi:hypothetical protein